MATPRRGLPYLYVTWLAKLLGGHECQWSAWFKAHYRYDKHETHAADLVQWNREHTELMRARRAELEREGFTVRVEQENELRLEAGGAVIAGKPDLIGLKPGLLVLVDGKTGRERDSDLEQVLIYLWMLPQCQPALCDGRLLEGEVQYRRGDQRISLTADMLTPEWRAGLKRLVLTLASSSPADRRPSRYECDVCNIGPRDCPERFAALAEPVARSVEF